MKKLMITGVALFAAAPAFAGPDCSKIDATMPMWQIAQAFENSDGKIATMKVSDGCYEIYGVQAGVDVEIYFDPSTGAELQREEG
jgi:hypothetical protein